MFACVPPGRGYKVNKVNTRQGLQGHTKVNKISATNVLPCATRAGYIDYMEDKIQYIMEPYLPEPGDGRIHILDLTRKLISEHGGFVSTKELVAEIRARNPKLWKDDISDQAIARRLARGLKPFGLYPTNGRTGRSVRKGYGTQPPKAITYV
jgi:hypothetical protein